ncbi:MAG: bifunctional phosphopantothenoylcysteine decarboxylase/phosphopantothenate--cysteine ligase CoaBC [Saprospiraceae bacterium]|nr:bifunctional phosphopantothenoylcysteine decarboxylase/phosphopantothenate--cysteine ligase CoaBC [Saprospiraceae bacterium]
MTNKKIILGITGSISAYKAAILLRLLTKSGAEVQVIMTEAAKDFIGPITLSTLSNKPVLHSLTHDQQWSQHVQLGLWADLLVVAPASAHTMAKFANGLADNLLCAVYLSARCPVMIAPAMDVDMWNHPATQNNIRKLMEIGHTIIPVEEGPLASGLEGKGRLAEPETIFSAIGEFFQSASLLSKKKVLITAGPTFEPIDPVRFIGNHSSGKMGIRLAEAALMMGAEVQIVVGPVSEPIQKHPRLFIHRVTTASEMFEKVKSLDSEIDIYILAAAVADFKPEHSEKEKIKKEGKSNPTLNLVPTPDIAKHLGESKKNGQFLCGFALETEHILDNAKSKLHKKNMDMIVINSPKDDQSAFGFDTNKISILENSGKFVSFGLQTKREAAMVILKAIISSLRT